MTTQELDDQMTQPQTSRPAHEPPFAEMLRVALIPAIAAVPVIVLVFWIMGQARGGLAALLGASIAVAFFASGLFVMKRVPNANPISVLAGALAVYFGQVIFLGFVIFALSGADWLDGKAFGLSVLAIALIWQVSQVVAFIRIRKPVFDEPTDPADSSADQPDKERLS